jgi:hypothetical protein
VDATEAESDGPDGSAEDVPRLTMKELEDLTGQPVRNIRYLIAEGIVPRPIGRKRWAHYGQEHVDAILRYAKSKEAARLDSLKAMSASAADDPPERRYEIADGVALVARPGAINDIERFAEQVRELLAANGSKKGELE